MDNINELLGSVLNDPESMARLRETARQLGLDPSGDIPAGDSRAESSPTHPEGPAGLVPALNKLAPLLGKLNEEDDMTRLIHALMPYLSGARLKRAEEAGRIVSIMRIIPSLRASREESE